jgi:hypothetical protein
LVDFNLKKEVKPALEIFLKKNYAKGKVKYGPEEPTYRVIQKIGDTFTSLREETTFVSIFN